MEEKYTRYGIDWQNEVMKNPKMFIVQMLRRVAMERDELQRRAVGQLPLCPKCGDTLFEEDRRWECVNESCGNCR